MIEVAIERLIPHRDRMKLIDAIVEEQRPLHERAREYESNPDLVQSILQEGREHARDAARDTLEEVRAAMGLHYR